MILNLVFKLQLKSSASASLPSLKHQSTHNESIVHNCNEHLSISKLLKVNHTADLATQKTRYVLPQGVIFVVVSFRTRLLIVEMKQFLSLWCFFLPSSELLGPIVHRFLPSSYSNPQLAKTHPPPPQFHVLIMYFIISAYLLMFIYLHFNISPNFKISNQKSENYTKNIQPYSNV